MRLILLGLLVVCVLIQGPGRPGAETALCGPSPDVMGYLASHGEAQVGVGVTHDGALLGVTVAESGAWTFVLHRPDGITCMIATGSDWQSNAPEDAPRPFPEEPTLDGPGR